MKDRIRITFGFHLYTISLKITLVIYFRRELNKLRKLELLEDNKVYHC